MPFFTLGDSEFRKCLDIDKNDILSNNSQLSEYITNLDNNNILANLNFNYVTDIDFNRKVSSITKLIDLSVIHLNIRSLNCNHRALSQFLELLIIKFDVIILSEIWSTNIDFYCNIFSGYTFHYDVPKDTHIGGIGLFIKNTFIQHERPDYKIPSTKINQNENIWYEISKNNKKFIIGGIYCHPNQNISEFTNNLEITLGKLANQPHPCIIAGDINIDLIKCTNNKPTTNYIDNLLTYNFTPTIVMPTRITERSSTLVDHMYLFEGKKKYDSTIIKSGNFLEDISDHLPNYTLIINNNKQSKSSKQMVRIMSKKNIQKFNDELSKIKWSTVYNSNEVNQAYESFLNIFNNTYNKIFTLTKVSRKRAKDKVWITSALKKSSHKKCPL